jgi:lantibiotic biosynthesis dehydratase-like protein
MRSAEYWIEVNLMADLAVQDHVLLDYLRPYLRRLATRGMMEGFHFFREPEIRFRVRLGDRIAMESEKEALRALANSLAEKGLVSEWHFGNHGEAGKEYVGERDRYGKNGWKVAQEYFQHGSEAALELLALRRKGILENPLWAKGLGNPWEGGKRNPWREREENPLFYHWSRYVHLFTNQLGFDIDEESMLCAKQSERYASISKEFGLKW